MNSLFPRLAIALSLGLILFFGENASAREWRGITPLHSTRADVMRMLGPPTIDDYIYDVDEGRINITYAGKRCQQGLPADWGNWNVPAGTVINIVVHLKNPISVSDLKVDLQKHYWYTDDVGAAYYHDQKEGVHYTVMEGKVVDITYGPIEKDDNLLCKKGVPKIRY
jgi:hypothetical protein